MRHANKNRTLSRTRSGRTALLRGLAVALINEGKVVTTEAKAKELRPFIERLVTHGKKNSVAGRRLVSSNLGEPDELVTKKLFAEIAPKYAERNGGYTRIIKMGRSKAGRDEAVIEFV
jgi:large subunit ribosomal protein L17